MKPNSEGVQSFRPEARIPDAVASPSVPVFSRPNNTADADAKYTTTKSACQNTTSGLHQCNTPRPRSARPSPKTDINQSRESVRHAYSTPTTGGQHEVSRCKAAPRRAAAPPSLALVNLQELAPDRRATGRCWWCQYTIPLEAGEALCSQCMRWAQAGSMIGEANRLLKGAG
jgi:hypothetical protein